MDAMPPGNVYSWR